MRHCLYRYRKIHSECACIEEIGTGDGELGMAGSLKPYVGVSRRGVQTGDIRIGESILTMILTIQSHADHDACSQVNAMVLYMRWTCR